MAGKGFSISAIFSAKDRLSAPIAKIQSGLSRLGAVGGKALGKLDNVVNKGFRGIGKFGNELGIAGALSLGAFALQMKDVIEVGAEFEKTLIRTGSAFEVPVRAGTEGFAKLTEAAREVGRTTEFSAQQAAEGLNSLATAGYSSEQAIAALPKIIDFASAANLELSQSSDIASDALGAFGLRSADATTNAANMARVMDSLTRAAADSTTNVAELFEGIKMGGSFAATSGVSIEQFTGLLGVLANKGIKGSEAGTAIRNSLLHLAKPTTEAKDTMAALGVRMAKTKDGSIDLAGTIGRFATATRKLTKDQKAAAIASVFGAYTVGPFLSLMDAGEGTIRNFTKNLEGAAGITKQMADTMRQSASAQLARFNNALTDVKLGVFAAIAPTVLQIADAVSKWVTANQGLITAKATEWTLALKENLPAIWTWTVRIAEAFGIFVAVGLTVKTVNAAIFAYETAVKVASGATWLWNTAVGASTSAVTLNWIAMVRSKVVMLASRAATLISTAAQAAYSYQINMSTVAAVRQRIAELASKIAMFASVAATVIGTTAQTAYAAVLGASTAGLGAFKVAALATGPAIGAQVAAMAPLLITLAAAAAAVVALKLAWDQYNALDKSLEGSGGVSGTVSKMWEMGTFDPFAAHDEVMNQKARDKRAELDERDKRGEAALERTQMISPQARAATANAEAMAGEAGAGGNVEGTITVKTEPGTKAGVKARPGPVAIKVQPSGAFPR
jgi:TP901 family phage tail tape measure protein